MKAIHRTRPAKRSVTFKQISANMDRLEKFHEELARQIQETDRQMQETDRQMKETDRQMKETDRQMKETDRQMKETDRQMKEAAAKTDRQMQETDRKISQLGSRIGEIIEAMVKPNLIGKFRKLGFVFTKIYPEAEIKDEKNKILAEIDLTLENGDKVMIVEVKSKPSIQDVRDHIKRMETVRRHGDLHGDKRKFLGSVAGMVIRDNVREFSLKNGFYIIEPSGDTFNIIVPEGQYSPREW